MPTTEYYILVPTTAYYYLLPRVGVDEGLPWGYRRSRHQCLLPHGMVPACHNTRPWEARIREAWIWEACHAAANFEQQNDYKRRKEDSDKWDIEIESCAGKEDLLINVNFLNCLQTCLKPVYNCL